MRGRRVGLALASALGALTIGGCLADGAFAEDGIDLPAERLHFHSLRLPDSSGYAITATGVHGEVMVSADSPADGASYRTAGTVTDERIAATFGQFGSVDMAFTPRGEPRTTRRDDGGCSIRTTTQRGLYSGSLVFTGENGFSSAAASSAPGKDVSQVIRCEFFPNPTGDGNGHRATLLQASGPSAVGRTLLWATKLDDRKRPMFTASTTSHLGDVTLVRYASADGHPGTFRFNRHRRSHALVTPPAPFTGSAHFTRQSKGHTTWAGDLAVTLPGLAAPAPLAGDEVDARMNRASLILFSTKSARRLGRFVSRGEANPGRATEPVVIEVGGPTTAPHPARYGP